MKVAFIWIFLIYSTGEAIQTFRSNESYLATKLLTGYNKELRPQNKFLGNKTLVRFGMTLSQIISVQEKTEELTTSVYLTINWEDHRFFWKPKEYENIEKVRMPPWYIWNPLIVLDNNKDGSFDVSLRTNTLIGYKGTVEWLPPALFKTSCKIDVSLFPFDWQNCSMTFKSSVYDYSELLLDMAYENEVYIDCNAFQKNGEWDLIGRPIVVRNSTTEPVFQNVTVYFIIKRKPQFYIMNMIIPCILMTSLSCFVFYLPSISCEKMTLSISILLGETVFLFLIAQRMPETSLAIPLIAGYLLFCMTLVILSVIFSVIVCNLHFRSKMTHIMPGWMVWLFMDTLAPLLKVERPAASEVVADNGDMRSRRASSITARRAMRERCARKAPSEMLFDRHASRMGFRQRHVNGMFGLSEVNANSRDDSNLFTIPNVQRIPKPIKSAAESICFLARHIKLEDELSQSQDDWAYVAMILDRALLWIYFVAFTVGTAGFFLKATFAQYPETEANTNCQD